MSLPLNSEMFQKRKSMLGRRHLLVQQQATSKQMTEDGSGDRVAHTNWRGGRSGKKKTPSNMDKSSRDFKKCLFSKSPAVSYKAQSQDLNLHSSNENLLNETGITSIAPTPRSTPRNWTVTPSTLLQRRLELEKAPYGALSLTARRNTKTANESDKTKTSVRSTLPLQTSCSYDFDNLKPPDSPGPSRLERILLEERFAEAKSSSNIYDLKPPTSPGPSRLDKLIMEEKLEQPVDPDLRKMQSLTLEDANEQLKFSPPMSSTYIGSPDSGRKTNQIKEEDKESVLGSGRKLSTIHEDCDVSVIEFELNERTIQVLDNTLTETGMNTVMPANTTCLENIQEEPEITYPEESEPSWETVISRLDDIERAMIDRSKKYVSEMRILKERLETIEKKIEKESKEDIYSIRLMKKALESLKRSAPIERLTENKENYFSFRMPTCKKKQLDEESKWFNSVKKENPGLLKTPNPSRKINQSALLTPCSLSNVLHDQMNELYK